jgi:hypothetical protein
LVEYVASSRKKLGVCLGRRTIDWRLVDMCYSPMDRSARFSALLTFLPQRSHSSSMMFRVFPPVKSHLPYRLPASFHAAVSFGNVRELLSNPQPDPAKFISALCAPQSAAVLIGFCLTIYHGTGNISMRPLHLYLGRRCVSKNQTFFHTPSHPRSHSASRDGRYASSSHLV